MQANSYVEVKVAWRCNTEQWWWAEVLYRKLGYSVEAIRTFALDPEPPVGAFGCGWRWRWLLAAGSFAGGIPRQPTPSHHDGECELRHGEGSKKKVGGKDKRIFWARTECGLVLSSVTPWELNHQ